MIKVGIIGCGRIAQRRHVPEYAKNPEAEIVGYFDVRHETAEELAKEYGGKVFDSVEDLLADPSIEAVSICVANNAHAETAIKALKAGKHVLCEKPMATNLEDCEKMVAAAHENDRYLMIAQNQRFNRGHLKARQLIREGMIGTPLTFKTTFGHGGPEFWINANGSPDIWFFDKKTAGMGAMADLGIHKIDLVQFLLDDVITEVTAKLSTLDKKDSAGNLIPLEDNAMCIFKMSKGMIGTLAASWTYYGEEDNSTKIYGTKGFITIYDHPDYALKVVTKEGDKIYYDIDQMMTNINQKESGVIREFVKNIENHEGPSCSADSVLPAMKAAFACFESNRTNTTVSVNQ